MMTCSVHQVTKMYGGNTIFSHISFEIKTGDRVGLVGRNGSGKTTLLQLLAGEETPDAGKIHWKKGCQTAYVKQIPGFNHQLIVREVLKQVLSELIRIEEKMKHTAEKMAQEMKDTHLQTLMEEYGRLQELYSSKGGYGNEATIEKVANGLNMDEILKKPILTLSGGDKTKVGLAFMLLKSPDFLLLDEPTNHLDIESLEMLEDALEDYDGTILAVSHDRYFLNKLFDKTYWIHENKVYGFASGYSWTKEKMAERIQQ